MANNPAPNPSSVPPPPPFPWRPWAIGAVVLAILWWSAADTGVSVEAFREGFPDLMEYFGRLLPTASDPWPLDYLPEIQGRLLETIKIALGASIIGAALALPYALVGAQNLAATRWVYLLGRGFLNLIRTIPDLVLASLLAAVFGAGPLAGMLALVIYTFSIVAKLLCDTVETIDPGPMESITAAGGTRVERALYAVFPQVGPDFAAYALYAFEINVRAAAVLGLVGAGGIGIILLRDIRFFAYDRVGLIIFVTFLIVLVIDSFSTWLRGKLV
ncbi:MAG: phosphonate ABC transporter, permease protein PhnE [Armatimonadaceae bacterium]